VNAAQRQNYHSGSRNWQGALAAFFDGPKGGVMSHPFPLMVFAVFFYLDQKVENTIQRTFEAKNYQLSGPLLEQATYPVPREKAVMDVRIGTQDIKEHKASDAGAGWVLHIYPYRAYRARTIMHGYAGALFVHA